MEVVQDTGFIEEYIHQSGCGPCPLSAAVSTRGFPPPSRTRLPADVLASSKGAISFRRSCLPSRSCATVNAPVSSPTAMFSSRSVFAHVTSLHFRESENDCLPKKTRSGHSVKIAQWLQRGTSPPLTIFHPMAAFIRPRMQRNAGMAESGLSLRERTDSYLSPQAGLHISKK